MAAPACTVRAPNLAFGAYDTINNLSGITTITVRCRRIQQGPGGIVAYSIALSTGSGSYAARQMISGANVLSYNLYVDPAHTMV
jgi:spore coat protein U-like protein